MSIKGKVYLVGAGPGDPELITIKGIECIKQCDVVLYDKLAAPVLLNYCKPGAEKIFVGKEAGTHHVRQEDTIEMLIRFANEGKDVVRLKGGDPLIFGRGSEEALALREAGIGFEFVPGITAASGTTAYAGIPLTHRNLATQVHIVTAHEMPGKEGSQVDWEKIAQLRNTTIVIYMGARLLGEITAKLLEYGMPADTPAAIIEKGTMPDQRVQTGTITDIFDIARANDFKPPMITVISPNVPLAGELSWFGNGILFGKRIVITRAADQSVSLVRKIREYGGIPVLFPVIKTALSVPNDSINNILKGKWNWLLFTSENGVHYFFELLERENLDARALSGIKIASVGSHTGKTLKEKGIVADLIPEKFTSASLLERLNSENQIEGNRFLRIKGYFDTDPLSDGIEKSGGFVQKLSVYSLGKDEPSGEAVKDLKQNGADCVLFTSMSTVNNMCELLGEDDFKKLMGTTYPLAIGPVTAEALGIKGISNYGISDIQTIDGMISHLIEAMK